MSNVIPYTNVRAVARQDRQVGRALMRQDAQAQLVLASIEDQAEIQTIKVLAVSQVTRTAMREVAFISQLEQQLSTLVPSATTRLQALGDVSAVAMVEILVETKSMFGLRQ